MAFWRNKHLFLSLFLIFSTTFLFAKNELSEMYLRKAYSMYMSGNQEMASELLEKSAAFSTDYPEYYYLNNLLLAKSSGNADEMKNNSRLTVLYIRNAFFIDTYSMIKKSIDVYVRFLDFDAAFPLFDRLLGDERHVMLSDILHYLSLLHQEERYGKILQVVQKSKTIYSDIDFKFYETTARIKLGEISSFEVEEAINHLRAHEYDEEKLLYLSVISVKSTSYIDTLIYKYLTMRQKNYFRDKNSRKDILFEFLSSSSFLEPQHIIYLAEEWIECDGLEDMRSNSIIDDQRLFLTIRQDTFLANSFLDYTGYRYLDRDVNGKWEEYREYVKGMVVAIVSDQNQDSIIEEEYHYYENGRPKMYRQYDDKNDYVDYVYNAEDSSLVKVLFYDNNTKKEEIVFLQSAYFPMITRLKGTERDSYMKYIDEIISYFPEKETTKYYNGKKQFSYIDMNNNQVYEKKSYFKDNQIYETVMDMNENGVVELKEEYEKGKLARVLYMSDEQSGIFDYIEEYHDTFLEQKWDENRDGFYEIGVDVFTSSDKFVKKIDINYDGLYDFEYEFRGDEVVRYYSRFDNTWKDINNISFFHDSSREANKGWMVVSPRDIRTVRIPDTIEFTNVDTQSGIYYYNNSRFFFKDGIIENNDFAYRVDRINNTLYLFDIKRM